MSMTSNEAWSRVVAEFRQACMLRREGKTTESARILSETLPASISAWSRETAGNATAKRSELDSMFREEQRKIDDASIVQQMVLNRLAEELLPALCSQVAQEMKWVLSEHFAGEERAEEPRDRTKAFALSSRPRIAFDDIPGIIDFLLTEQQNNNPKHALAV